FPAVDRRAPVAICHQQNFRRFSFPPHHEAAHKNSPKTISTTSTYWSFVTFSRRTSAPKINVITGYAPLIGLTNEMGPFCEAMITIKSPPAIIPIGTNDFTHSRDEWVPCR